jgi:hypothetical protein
MTRASGPAPGEVSAHSGGGQTMTHPLTPDNAHPFGAAHLGRPEMSRTQGHAPLNTAGPGGASGPGGGYDGYAGRDMADTGTWLRGPHIASGGMFGRLHQEQDV